MEKRNRLKVVLIAMASTFAPSLVRLLFNRRVDYPNQPWRTDRENIAGDWHRVGNDVRRAARRHNERRTA